MGFFRKYGGRIQRKPQNWWIVEQAVQWHHHSLHKNTCAASPSARLEPSCGFCSLADWEQRCPANWQQAVPIRGQLETRRFIQKPQPTITLRTVTKGGSRSRTVVPLFTCVSMTDGGKSMFTGWHFFYTLLSVQDQNSQQTFNILLLFIRTWQQISTINKIT